MEPPPRPMITTSASDCSVLSLSFEEYLEPRALLGPLLDITRVARLENDEQPLFEYLE